MTILSLMQKSFEDVHDEFFFACSHGDYLSVERLLQNGSISHADISTTKDNQRLSPIIIAIEHNHLAVIQILLDHLPYSDFREVLLLAIYLDLTKIAQIIMEHDTFKCFYGTFADWQTDTVATYDESYFAAIRPIQLAAQYNRTAILYDFLKRGKQTTSIFKRIFFFSLLPQVNGLKFLIISNAPAMNANQLVPVIVYVTRNCVFLRIAVFHRLSTLHWHRRIQSLEHLI